MKLINYYHYDEHIITNIDNPDGRIKYKDIRKISIGISKKDILNNRCKKKGAFYNCFVLIVRVLLNNEYKEIHFKVFNTGKLEIPGIKNEIIFNKSLDILVNAISPFMQNNEFLLYLEQKTETVLINSNFNCGFNIDREKLFNILKYNYSINCHYDPCSYPGIQCEFYYNKMENVHNGKKEKEKEKENTIKISFMIFRTGSVLIVGKCEEDVIYIIYNFLKKLLSTEYINIKSNNEDVFVKNKITKKRKNKKLLIYFDNNMII